MSILKKLKKQKKTPKSTKRHCELCSNEATPGRLYQKVKLCASCRVWIFNVATFTYALGGVNITLKPLGRRALARDEGIQQGIVLCSNCEASFKTGDFRRHKCIKHVKTTMKKLRRVIATLAEGITRERSY